MKLCNIADCSILPRLLAALIIGLWVANSNAQEKNVQSLKEDKQQVKSWNEFASELYTLHESQLAQHPIRIETSQGGYVDDPNAYTETRYYDKSDNHLLSRVHRMNDDSKFVQLVEVNIYNEQGQIVRDYLAAYLPYNRNAPIQTLINLHGYDGELHGFRQFDASGARIYEQCSGRYAGHDVMISLEEYEFQQGAYQKNKILNSPEYQHCFAGVPTSATPYLQPVNEFAAVKVGSVAQAQSEAEIVKQIALYTEELKQHSRDVATLIKRGDLYFQIHEFEQAIADYSDAISLDKNADGAYFGRGMALGRYGQIRKGINDLSVYIRRHPTDSRAFTKRGVRYMWIHEDAHAEKDFAKAIKLNPANAEAHDDLGVIHARRGDYVGALKHFNAAVQYDTTYFKAYHNQAMVYYINGQDALALAAVDKSLELVPDQRNSMLLKADILKALGRVDEADKVKGDAEFLPEGNWSEHISVK